MKQLSTGSGHTVRVETNHWVGSITVFYDGNKVATGNAVGNAVLLGLGGANCMFQVVEDNQPVTYECSTRLALFSVEDHLTVRRNGIVIYID